MIHPTAIVDKTAEIASDVEIGGYSIIGPGVCIESGTRIADHVVIRRDTYISKDNMIYQFSSIGEDCQDKKYIGEKTQLVIGERNIIREFVTLHRGTAVDRGETVIGNDNLFMAYVHVAHDCVIGSGTIFANNATLAGHVTVGDGAILGGFTGVHQFCQIGMFSMSSMFSAINKDVPAFVMVQGNMATPRGMNFEGMRRRGYSENLMNVLKQAYKIVYNKGLTLEKALIKLTELTDEPCPELEFFIESIKNSKRGIIR